MAKQISMVRILRDPDDDVEDVTVGDSLAEILDVNANITARCDLPQLETVFRINPATHSHQLKYAMPYFENQSESHQLQTTTLNSSPERGITIPQCPARHRRS